jgi:hypothetical protein
MPTPTPKIIEPPRDVRAACASGHTWAARHHVEDRGVRCREGRRAARVIAHVVTPEHCPTCGHGWTGRLCTAACAGIATDGELAAGRCACGRSLDSIALD